MSRPIQGHPEWACQRNRAPSLQDRYLERRKTPSRVLPFGPRVSSGWIPGSQRRANKSSQKLPSFVGRHEIEIRITCRDKRGRARPYDPEHRIVPAYAARTFGIVELRDLIEHIGVS